MKLTAGLALLVLACSSAPTLPPALVTGALCAYDAVKDLPRDPDLVTLGQAKELARSLRDCEKPDAGAQ